ISSIGGLIMTDKERLEECEKQILKGVKRLLNSPEMQCNHCGMIFKGDHECDYEYLKEQNKRYRATINVMSQILKDAIHSLDYGEKVQGLEYGVEMANESLESESE